MLSEFDTDAQLKSITLAEYDFAEKIFFSQRVHGRSNNVAMMMSTFDKVCSGSNETILVKGVLSSEK